MANSSDSLSSAEVINMKSSDEIKIDEKATSSDYMNQPLVIVILSFFYEIV
jgi:hypothetical protein